MSEVDRRHKDSPDLKAILKVVGNVMQQMWY
jgi:hypothetical protein